MSFDPRLIADLLDQEGNVLNEMADQPLQPQPLPPGEFINAMNAVIASAPHGQQGAVLKRLAELAATDQQQLVAMLQQLTPVPGTNYLQDFFRSRGSNIMAVAGIASALYDETTVMEILDAISSEADDQAEDDNEDELEYNSEGDGYSH